MKKIVLLVMLVGMVACKSEPVVDPVPEKPFIIIKRYYCFTSKSVCCYVYMDKNGKTFNFSDVATKYSVGDTIK